MKYQAIKDHARRFNVRLMCRALQVSPAGYYDWRDRPESARTRSNRRLLVAIRACHARSQCNYGSPRITRELREAGERCSENRVARLMRAHDVRAKRAKKWRATTQSRHALPVARNTLNRQFEVSAPNQVWASDISYLWTEEGWVYLAVVMDLYSRAVIGWSMRTRLTTELALEALQMALWRRKPGSGLLHHSDRGVQYAAADYQRVLAEHGIECSMSRKGNCWDNACVESFFSTLKLERVYQRRYLTREDARRDVLEWIEFIYNRQRRHSALGYRSPTQFENLANVA
jgi:transposase InsO family protein